MADHDIKLHTIKAKTFEQKMKAEGDSFDAKKLPEFTFDFEMLPEGKDWSDGKSYRIVLEGKQVGSRSHNGKGSVTISVEKIGGELVHRSSHKRFSRRNDG